MITGPLVFESSPRHMVWGGRDLAEVLNKPLPDLQPYGEAWEVSDHPRHGSIARTGPLEGQSLRRLMENHARSIVGHAPADRFPWLLKWLDCNDWLSVQVHPDANQVTTLWPGEGPKNEAWFVLRTRPGAKVWAGLLPGVTAEQLRETAAQGTIADCLHSFEPRPGDCLYLPAGTVHAVGGGVLMAEIQQTSDATFRLFDWNRVDAHGVGRQLHLEESIACIDWNRGPVNPVRASNLGMEDEASSFASLVDSPYFSLAHIAGNSEIQLPCSGKLGALFVLHGKGTLTDTARGEALVAGDTAILPACSTTWIWKPNGPSALLLAMAVNDHQWTAS